jgi:hypothetical protein
MNPRTSTRAGSKARKEFRHEIEYESPQIKKNNVGTVKRSVRDFQ